jgi:hypothetical protein
MVKRASRPLNDSQADEQFDFPKNPARTLYPGRPCGGAGHGRRADSGRVSYPP